MTSSTDPEMKRTARDSVFCDLFSQKKYLLELYRSLHPDDISTTIDDLEIVTIERVVSDGEYNDVGFTADNRLLLLVEAQTEWSPNIATRMLLYLAETYRRNLFNRNRSLHEHKIVEMPVPELYVVYTGKRDVPDTVLFTRDILEGATNSALELCVRVLRSNTAGIVGEYVGFAGIVGEVNADRTLAPNEKAAEVVRRCRERGILKTYMAEREQEVRGIMFTLFDQERETKLYHERLRKQATEEGLAEGLKQGRTEGLKQGRAEGRAEALESFAAKLREQGIDESTLNSALAELRIEAGN